METAFKSAILALALVLTPSAILPTRLTTADRVPSALTSTTELYEMYVTPPGRQQEVLYLELKNAAGQALKGDYLVTTVVDGAVLGPPIVYRSERNLFGDAVVKITASNAGNPTPLTSRLLFQLPDGTVTAPPFNLPPDPLAVQRQTPPWHSR